MPLAANHSIPLPHAKEPLPPKGDSGSFDGDRTFGYFELPDV